ncbi:hypothetical protein CBR_g37995 [Chara braunii]|uniref:Uncharacterized protein n=1 Tax=Chara braunii TaxID=69332 RepID=A0A388LP51_CHABU|nr:hypothetical protein CBR_g37995 [Chara braunii]|eukprot:GBG84120.1 hypothetical protein CBR_g37995 [Chara braunii]
MAARIRDNGSAGANGGDGNGILAPLVNGGGTPTALLPYQGGQARNYGGYNAGYNGNYNGGGGYIGGSGYGQRYPRSGGGGYRERDHKREDKIDRMYNLPSEQVEE